MRSKLATNRLITKIVTHILLNRLRRYSGRVSGNNQKNTTVAEDNKEYTHDLKKHRELKKREPNSTLKTLLNVSGHFCTRTPIGFRSRSQTANRPLQAAEKLSVRVGMGFSPYNKELKALGL
jgi:hypothetical protein